MKLDLVDLGLFVNIAETGNLTHGASKSFLSPPAASARIKALEQEVGRPLLVRENKGVRLTGDGQTFLRQARLVLRQVDFLHDEMLGAGRIRLFANTTAVTEILPDVLAGFLAERPGVKVDLQERTSSEVIRGVTEGVADLGVVSGDVPMTGLEVTRFSEDRLVLVTPADHPALGARSLRLEDSLAYDHVGLHDGSTLNRFLRDQVPHGGYERSLRIQVRSYEAMCRMIEAGVGIGVMPESAACRHAAVMNVRMTLLKDSWALRHRSILVRDRHALSGICKALMDHLIAKGDTVELG